MISLDNKKILLNEINDYLFIAIGLACYAVGWTVFMLPYGITLGGVTGISALIYFATGIELQIPYFIINGLLLIAALKILGFKFCAKTIYAVVALTVFLKIGQEIMKDSSGEMIQILGADEDFMSCIIGACMCGVGVGVCFAHNGSTGGTDIVAAIINKYKDISLGHTLLLIDIFIIGSGYIVFHDIRRVMFGYVSMLIMSLVLDYYVNSMRQSVQFMIFSKKHQELADYINKDLHRGVTVLDGTGWYSKQPMKVIVVLTKKRDSVNFFRAIQMIDPNAFISQSNVRGVYGEGFDKIKVK